MIWDGERFVFKSSASGRTVDMSFLSADRQRHRHLGEAARHRQTGAHGVMAVAGRNPARRRRGHGRSVQRPLVRAGCPGGAAEDSLQIAAYCEGSDPPHYYGCTTADPATLDRRSDQDLAYQLMNFGYNRTACQYSSDGVVGVMSYMARILTTQWGGIRSTITLMYKREPGVPPEQLSTNQANVVQAKELQRLCRLRQ